MYKYLLWDHDGVLVDTEHWYFAATRRALAELDVSLSEAMYQRYMVRGESCWELAAQRGADAARIDAQRQRRSDYYQHYLATESIDIPGVSATLALLAPRHRMAIVTTCKRADFELIHRSRNLIADMEFILVREDYAQSKPHPEPYLRALDRFGAEPDEALVIEDSERGLRAAQAAGIDCAIVHNRFTAGHDFSGATYQLPNLAALVELLSIDDNRLGLA